MKPFQIKLEFVKASYRLNVTLINENDQHETFEVRAKNHVFYFTCNRKLMLAGGIDHLPWVWSIEPPTAGKNRYMMEEIRLALEKVLRGSKYR